MALKRKDTPEHMAEKLMKPVNVAMGHRVTLIVKHIVEEYLVPRDERIEQLEAEIIRLGGEVPPSTTKPSLKPSQNQKSPVAGATEPS